MVTVSVVHIRHVRVRVSHWFVLVRMRVWFAGRITSLMGMSVVHVVNMRMRVDQSLMNVFMFMTFGQV